MKIQHFALTAMSCAILTACGGGGGDSGSASSGPNANACDILCIDSMAATNFVMLSDSDPANADSTSLSANLVGNLKSKATFKWDMGDGSAPQTTATVSGYKYANPSPRTSAMYRITLTVAAPDDNGVTRTATKQMQVHVLRQNPVTLSGTGVLVLGNNGVVSSTGAVSRSVGSETGSHLGRPISSTVSNVRNLDAVLSVTTGANGLVRTRQLNEIRSLGDCINTFNTCQSFAIERNTGALYGAGNDKDDYATTTTRATGVNLDADPSRFELSRNAASVPLVNIKYVVTRGQLNDSAYALRGDGSAFATGNNDLGRLGVGSTASRLDQFNLIADRNGAATQIVQIAASSAKVFVLKSDGSVWAAGANNSGTNGGLGVANSKVDFSNVLIPAKDSQGNPLTNVKYVQADASGSVYAVRWDGSLWVSGYNVFGELGTGTTGLGGPDKGFEQATDTTGAFLTQVDSVWTTRSPTGGNRTFVSKNTDGGSTLLVAGDAAAFVATTDADNSGNVKRFARVVDLDANKNIVKSWDKVVSVRTDYGNYSTFIDSTGKTWVHGKTGDSNLPYSASEMNNTATNQTLANKALAIQYANWTDNRNGQTLFDRTALANPVDTNRYYLKLVNDPVQTMLFVAIGAYGGAAIGLNGELYLSSVTTGNRNNMYATNTAMVPASPAVDGLRFVTP